MKNSNLTREALIAENRELKSRLKRAEADPAAPRKGAPVPAASEAARGLLESIQGTFAILEAIRGASGKPEDWRFIEANRTAARIFGVSRKELLGRTVRGLTGPGDRPILTELASAAAKSAPYHGEFHSSRFRRWFSLYTHPAGADRLALLMFDVTEQRRTMENLRLANGLLEAVTEGTGAVISTIDREYRFTFSNAVHRAELKRLTGQKVKPGLGLKEIFAEMPEQRRAALAVWKRALTGETVTQTFTFGDPGRYRRHYAARYTPLRDEAGRIIGAGEVSFDVTPQVEAEAKLRESEEKYRGLFAAMTEGFALSEIVCDNKSRPRDYRYLEVNRAWETITGRKAAEVTGQSAAALGLREDLFRLEQFGRVALSGEPSEFEHYEERTERWLHIRVYSPQKGLFARTITDITARKRAEEAVRSAAKFPSENPNPVLRLSRDGTLTYANQAAEDILVMWRCAVGRRLPDDWLAVIEKAAATEPWTTIDVPCGARLYSLMIVPVTNENYVNLYGRDISDLKKIENDLRLSERHLSRAQELSHLGSWETDFTTHTLTWSNELYRIFELEPDGSGPTFEAFLEIVHPDDRGALNERYRTALMERRESSEAEFRIVRKQTGEVRFVHMRMENTKGETGDIVGSTGTLLDITDRKLAVEALRASERRFRSLTENSPDLVARVDGDLRFRYVNGQLLRLIGATPENFMGRTAAEAGLPGPLAAAWDALFDRARKTRLLQEAEFDIPVRAEDMAFNIRVLPESSEDETVESFLVIGRDITPFRQTRRELERTRNYLNNLLDYASAPIIVWNPQSVVTLFNRAFERLTGYESVEIVGQHLSVLFPPESRENSLQKIRQTLAGEYLEAMEIPILQKTGSVRIVLWNSANIYADGGTILSATIAQGQDFTERKRAEEAMIEAHAEAVREKTRLEAVMETLPVGVAILDRQGGKVRYNRMFDEVWGGAPSRTASTADYAEYQGWWLDSGKPVAADEWAASLALSRGRQVVGQMIRIRRFDGREAYALNSASPIFEADGSVAGCVVAIQDITRRILSERAIEESEKRYRTLFNSMTEGFALHEIILDDSGAPADYRFLDVNPAFETLTGLAREDVIGKTRNEVPQLAGDDPVWLERYGRVALTGEPAHFDNFSPALRRHYEVFAYCPLPRHFAVVFMDVTERKKREQELHTLNRTLKALGESNRVLLAATDERSFLDAVCRIVVQDCGYSMVWIGFAENDNEKTVQPAAHAGFEDGYIETLKVTWADSERGRGPTGTAVRTGEARMCRNMQVDPAFAPWREEAIKRGYASSIAIPLCAGKDSFGAITIYSSAVDPFLNDEVRLLTGLADDVAMGITTIRARAARDKAEAALRESERRFQIIIKNSPVAFFLQDLGLKYRWIYNPTQHLAERSIAGKTDADLYGTDQARELMTHKQAVITSGRGRRFEFHGVEQGKEYDQLIALEPHRDGAGQVLGVYGVSLDITARKQAEAVLERDRETLERLVTERTDELLAARSELETARRLSDIGTLAATVAHELRNPLAAITVAAANIERKAKNALLESHLSNIRKKVLESDQIINNLLFFSRIKSPRRQETEIHAVLIECLESIDFRFPDRITIEQRVEEVRGVTIPADPVQLLEVFANLMNNAQDALGEKGGRIEITGTHTADRVIVRIADNGVGIEAKDRERVFEPFFTTKSRGTGLGLAVCRQIVTLHDGDIGIESVCGEGTTVTVSLPKKA